MTAVAVESLRMSAPSWRVKLVLFATVVLVAILLNGVGPVILQMTTQLGIPKRTAGLLEAMKDLPAAFFAIAIGSYLPRLGYRRSMLIALAGLAGGCAYMAALGTFASAFVLFLCVGLSTVLIRLTMLGVLALIALDKREHMSLLGAIDGAVMLGVLFGHWLFSIFIGSDPSNPDWLRIFWLLMAASIAIFILVVYTRLPEFPVSHLGNEQMSTGRKLAAAARSPILLLFGACMVAYQMVEQGVGSWLPTYNHQVLGMPAQTSVQVAGLFAASLAIGRFAAGALLRKTPWITVLAIGTLAAIVLIISAQVVAARGVGPISGWRDIGAGALLIPCIGLFIGPLYPTLVSIVLTAAPARLHDATSSFIWLFTALGGTFGSFLVGTIYQGFGGRSAFLMLVIPLFVMFIGLFLLRTRLLHEKA